MASANGTLGFGGYLDVYADGAAGWSLALDERQWHRWNGETINFKASGANASVTVAQSASLHANGKAGGAGDCLACGAVEMARGAAFTPAHGTGARSKHGNIYEYADGYGGSPADGGMAARARANSRN